MPPTGQRPGRRRRRLRWTIGVLCALGIVGLGTAAAIYLGGRADGYRPGEKLDEITNTLARELPEEAPRPELIDVTAAAGLGSFRTFAGERTSQLPEDMGSGAAWGDYDGDGDDDLFLVAAGGALDLPVEERAPSLLYENLGDGTFAVVDDFPETRIVGMGAAWGDYDGDGRLDLVVSGYNALRLFHNDGGRLVRDDRIAERPGYWAGVSWGDHDNDRDLDLYVCGYVQYREDDAERLAVSVQYGETVPVTLNPSTYDPERNLLFRNDGGRFVEVAEELGVHNPEGRSLGALWHDLDGDGWLDLYVANDISDNVLFRNTGGGFEEISHAAWVADYRGAMGLAAGDWNRDGDDDIFVTHWVAQENALYDSQLRQAAGGAGLRFMDIADQRGLGQIALRSVGWGTEFADLDADGWLDLVVANGSTFESNGEDGSKRLRAELPFLLWNGRGDHFFDLAPLVPPLATPHVARGLAVADYDLDGDLDLLTVHHGEGVQLLRNEIAGGNWMRLVLDSRATGEGGRAGHADGSHVVAHVGDVRLRRTVGSVSYLSQSSRALHLGLGEASSVDRLEVHWHAGGTDVHENLEANVTWRLAEGNPAPIVVPTFADEKEKVIAFWRAHRAAMAAMKREQDLPKAMELFREALAIDPRHEDARYYLANSLAATGDVEAALDHLETLLGNNPMSHRAHKQWGTLRALNATSDDDLGAAAEALERAMALNPEESGATQVLGEIALLRGEVARAEKNLEWACRSNPRSVGGFFLRGYLAWSRGDSDLAARLLEQAREAAGEEWKPADTTAEGDVENKMHAETTPLSRFWEGWSGVAEPAPAFGRLDAFLKDRS